MVQSGTHRQLLVQEGLYRTLWQAQTDKDAGLPLPYEGLVSANGKHGADLALATEGYEGS